MEPVLQALITMLETVFPLIDEKGATTHLIFFTDKENPEYNE